jgi:toxin ParE1/3/4
MTHAVILSDRAERQLDNLFETIEAESGRERAKQFTSSILAYCRGFSTFPERGLRRDDILPGARVVGFRRRVSIVFVVEPGSVVFLGIYYGGQDFESDLKEDST